MKDDGGRIDENESDRREGSHQMFLRVVYPGKMALRFNVIRKSQETVIC